MILTPPTLFEPSLIIPSCGHSYQNPPGILVPPWGDYVSPSCSHSYHIPTIFLPESTRNTGTPPGGIMFHQDLVGSYQEQGGECKVQQILGNEPDDASDFILLRDPSKMHKSEIEACFKHWLSCQENGDIAFAFSQVLNACDNSLWPVIQLEELSDLDDSNLD